MIEFTKPEEYIDFSHLNKLDESYMNLIQKILIEGVRCKNRTGIDTLALSGYMIQHDMCVGFPLLTVKKTAFKTMSVELEGFLKGITSKKWYQDRKCNIWNEWCNPKALKEVIGENVICTREKYNEIQAGIDDLGPIYGSQWNDFNGIDQLYNLMSTLKRDPDNRRLIVSAWNPTDIGKMSLPPCHVMFQVSKMGEKLDLCWYQRSCDVPLGIPFNIASYGLLLSIICHITGYKPGKLIGFLSNVHIYENQIDAVTDELIPNNSFNKIDNYNLPTIKFKEDSDIRTLQNFEYTDVELIDYNPRPHVAFPIAI